MFFLLLVALASAADYLIKTEGFKENITPLDVCVSTGASKTEKSKKKSDTEYEKCTYDNTDCSGSGKCETVKVASGSKISSTIPDNIAFSKSGSTKDCPNYDKIVGATAYNANCVVFEANATYTKMAVENKKLVQKLYKDKECKTTLNETEAKGKSVISVDCDKCKQGFIDDNDSSTWTFVYCQKYNGSALTAILMVVFALFFLF